MFVKKKELKIRDFADFEGAFSEPTSFVFSMISQN
jgi:hypothetical protein